METFNFLCSKFIAVVSTESTKAGEVIRRSSNYHPSVWGDYFLDVSTDDVMPNFEVDKRIESLKEDVRRMLQNKAGKPQLEEPLMITLIDTLQRLGVAYHFENQINEALKSIYSSSLDNNNNNGRHEEDLYTVSLRFRLLRQQGYTVPSDVFKKFIDDKGEFKATLANDARGLLCLFESSNLRMEGEDILEKAIEFSRRQLKSMLPHLKSPLSEQVKCSLDIPLHKRMQRMEARHYISMYEEDETRNDLLLELAKLDFNLLQKLYRRELSDLSRWWKAVDFPTKLPFARNRLVECYFWILGIYFEPKYSINRKYMTKILTITSNLDDIYDVYGTLEELKLFTEAIERWEDSTANELPEYMQVCYSALLDAVKEMKDNLANEGREYHVEYAKEAMKVLVRAYFVEAIWFYTKYMPTFEEYLGISMMSGGYPMLSVQALVGLDEVATKEAFDWAISFPEIIRSCAFIARLADDIQSYKVEQERGDAPSGVQCYMKDHNVSEEEACKKIKEMIDTEWKNFNKGIQEASHPPLPLLLPSLNLLRMLEVFYQNEDGYSDSAGKTKEKIASMVVDPIPI